MIKLELPKYTYQEIIQSCKDGVLRNSDLLQKLNIHTPELLQTGANYEYLASNESLYQIVPNSMQLLNDTPILGELTKYEFIKLYEYYFKDSKKPCRTIYNYLLSIANEDCPFCGGIGRPKNLDHYLPKAHFPQYSIYQLNLVPICRDCNFDGKGERYAYSKGEQVIQPYKDHDRYFNQKWIEATYIPGHSIETGVIQYYVCPPENWTIEQKQRVINHFNAFELNIRYSKEASSRLVTILAQIQNLVNIGISNSEAKAFILQPIINSSQFINHWESVMCSALLREL